MPLKTPKRRIAAGMALLAIASLGLAVIGGRWLLLDTRHHVVVEISKVDGIEQIFIDCHLAAHLETGEPSKTVDLGWLMADDRIYISTTSIDSSPAWDFFGTDNGGFLFHRSRGSIALPRYRATPQAVVFAQAFSAAGARLGAVGCQAPGSVAEDLADVEGYAWSPDDKEVPETTDAMSSYRRPNDFYDHIDAVGGWMPTALAVLGFAVAFLTPSIVRFAWEHKGRLAGGALALLGAGILGVAALPTILIAVGVLLLVVTAVFLAVEGVVSLSCDRRERLKGAAGARGA